MTAFGLTVTTGNPRETDASTTNEAANTDWFVISELFSGVAVNRIAARPGPAATAVAIWAIASTFGNTRESSTAGSSTR